eukprot:TRINITY_DN4161_c0_g1_i3.p1 TRINITY_DN4161_c0_g1~~TRINITY_DN4161_c0_g1_i3.p1  ORF type:complete len:350 (+),score=70.32 TRINITY_DN4161_c0_g1_i3:83-1051(+)
MPSAGRAKRNAGQKVATPQPQKASLRKLFRKHGSHGRITQQEFVRMLAEMHSAPPGEGMRLFEMVIGADNDDLCYDEVLFAIGIREGAISQAGPSWWDSTSQCNSAKKDARPTKCRQVRSVSWSSLASDAAAKEHLARTSIQRDETAAWEATFCACAAVRCAAEPFTSRTSEIQLTKTAKRKIRVLRNTEAQQRKANTADEDGTWHKILSDFAATRPPRTPPARPTATPSTRPSTGSPVSATLPASTPKTATAAMMQPRPAPACAVPSPSIGHVGAGQSLLEVSRQQRKWKDLRDKEAYDMQFPALSKSPPHRVGLLAARRP